MLDWNLLRVLVAVAEEGSLSGAARRMGSSQPTMGRRINELEEAFGLSLFDRHPRGLTLTERGAALYEHARRVQDDVDGFARAAQGLSETAQGTVRISASDVVSHFVLPGFLAQLRRTEPGIEFEIVSGNEVVNLLRRDADIAIRMFRPEQQELIARQVGSASLGLYASAGYLEEMDGARVGWRDHVLIGPDRDTYPLRMLKRAGFELRRQDFSVRSDAQSFQALAAQAGAGIAGMQDAVAARLGGLVRLDVDLEMPPLPVWLVAHKSLRRSVRVRRVYDALGDYLSDFYAPRGGAAAAE